MRASPSRSTPTSCFGSRASTRCCITIEEGAIGGFAAHVLQTLADHGVLDGGLKVRSMVLPDIFIDQDSPAAMYAKAGLDAKGIVAKAFEALGQNLRGETVKLGRGSVRIGSSLSALAAGTLATFALAAGALARHLLAFLARLREADGDRLLAAPDLSPLLPLLSVPRLRLRIARSTSFEALREYRRAMVHPFLIRREP